MLDHAALTLRCCSCRGFRSLSPPGCQCADLWQKQCLHGWCCRFGLATACCAKPAMRSSQCRCCSFHDKRCSAWGVDRVAFGNEICCACWLQSRPSAARGPGDGNLAPLKSISLGCMQGWSMLTRRDCRTSSKRQSLLASQQAFCRIQSGPAVADKSTVSNLLDKN